MKSKAYSILLLLLITVSSNTYSQVSIGIIGTVGIPTGTFGVPPTVTIMPPNIIATASSGYGGTLFGRYYINPHIAVGLNGSCIFFGGQNLPFNNVAKDYTIPTGTFTTYSLTTAIDYYIITKKVKPFVGIELGFILTQAQYHVPEGPSNGEQDISTPGVGFGMATQIGLAYELAHHFDVLVNIKYVIGMNEVKYNETANELGIPATTYLGINLGVQYKFGR